MTAAARSELALECDRQSAVRHKWNESRDVQRQQLQWWPWFVVVNHHHRQAIVRRRLNQI